MRGRDQLSGRRQGMAQRASDRSKGCGSHRLRMVRQADPFAFFGEIPMKNEGDIVQNKKQCIFFVKICNSFFASCRFYVILTTVNHGGICASILIEFFIFILLYYQRRAETYEHYFKSESKNNSFTR